MKCLNCEKEYEGYGKTCGACRVRLSREKSVTEKPVTLPEVESVTLKKVEVTGLCHGCKEQQSSTSVCICHLCIAKDVTHKGLGLEMCKA